MKTNCSHSHRKKGALGSDQAFTFKLPVSNSQKHLGSRLWRQPCPTVAPQPSLCRNSEKWGLQQNVVVYHCLSIGVLQFRVPASNAPVPVIPSSLHFSFLSSTQLSVASEHSLLGSLGFFFVIPPSLKKINCCISANFWITLSMQIPILLLLRGPILVLSCQHPPLLNLGIRSHGQCLLIDLSSKT